MTLFELALGFVIGVITAKVWRWFRTPSFVPTLTTRSTAKEWSDQLARELKEMVDDSIAIALKNDLRSFSNPTRSFHELHTELLYWGDMAYQLILDIPLLGDADKDIDYPVIAITQEVHAVRFTFKWLEDNEVSYTLPELAFNEFIIACKASVRKHIEFSSL